MSFDLCKIGQLLKHAREEKGFSLEEVANALCVRKSTVEAIESGDWHGLPHPVYVRGYATQYASFVDALNLFQVEVASEETPPPEEEQQSAPVERQTVPRRPVVRFKFKTAAGMALAASVVVAFLIFENTQRLVPRTPLPQRHAAQSGSTAVAATPVAQPAVDYQKAETDQPAVDYQKLGTAQAAEYQKAPAEASSDVQKVAVDPATSTYNDQEEKLVLETKKLMIACRERTWVRILIDGSETKEFMMNPDEVVMFNAKDKFDLLIGNAGGVKIFYNGKDTGFTGEDGEVKRINLS